jgi:hypothetical protein
MDFRLPYARKSEQSVKHGWNSLEDYLYQYERRLEDYPGFIIDFSFEPELISQTNPPLLYIKMQLKCSNNINLEVEKIAEIRIRTIRSTVREEAKTIDYSYNASIINKGNILRYDNAHAHSNHPTKHHKHVFEPPGIEIEGSPFPLKDDEWPHMHQVIEELIVRFG